MSDIEIKSSVWIRAGLIITGTLSLALGIIGLLLPVMPTTPFLLLTAACYIRSSPRLYQWLITRPFFGQLIENYRNGHGVPGKIKGLAIAILWLACGISAVFMISSLLLRLFLLGIAITFTIHILRVKTCAPSKNSQQIQ